MFTVPYILKNMIEHLKPINFCRWLLVMNITTVFYLSSCTYSFSNLNVNLRGLSSIGVESAFNTDSTPSPHELLWSSMQEAIIKDGHLKLRSSEDADATIAMKINELSISPSGSVTTSALDTDPSKAASPENPISADSFLRLAQSYSYNANNVIVLDVTVQVYHLRTKNVMFEKRYHYSEELSSLYNYHYPVYKEALKHDVKKLADKVSYNTVRDFLYTK